MSRRVWIAGASTVIAIVVALAIFGNDLSVVYHNRAMLRAWDKSLKAEPGERMEWDRAYKRHRDALVECGFLVRRDFHLRVTPPQTSALWRHIMAEFQDNIHSMMETTQWGHPENKIIVWDRPDRMPAWEAAIARYDVPQQPASMPATAPE